MGRRHEPTCSRFHNFATRAKAQFLSHPVRPAKAGRFHGELKPRFAGEVARATNVKTKTKIRHGDTVAQKKAILLKEWS